MALKGMCVNSEKIKFCYPKKFLIKCKTIWPVNTHSNNVECNRFVNSHPDSLHLPTEQHSILFTVR